jgi:hypothetical protein
VISVGRWTVGVSLEATSIDIGHGTVDWVVMADADGNQFCLLSPR